MTGETHRGAQDGAVYRYIYKDSVTHPTCVIAGRDRRRVWWYVHAATPTVLRLHPPVVRFLLDVVADLAQPPDSSVDRSRVVYRMLPKDVLYPGCLVTGRRGQEVWLHVLAATPSAVRLVPAVVEFLQEALADLPATAGCHNEYGGNCSHD